MHQHLLPAARRVARSFRLAAVAASFVLAGHPGYAGDLTLPADALDRLAARSAATTPPEPYIRIHEAAGGFRAVVMGDSMADGMYSGLYRVMKDEAKLEFVKKTKVNTGIVRSDRYDWNEAAREIAGEKKYDIAVLVFGANDLQSIREGGKAYHFRQPGWEERFARRIDDIIASLKAQNIATYWVGLPITPQGPLPGGLRLRERLLPRRRRPQRDPLRRDLGSLRRRERRVQPVRHELVRRKGSVACR